MLEASYEVWALGILGALFAVWILKHLIRRKRAMGQPRPATVPRLGPEHRHDIEHRALMYLMNQKTDALLAALALTIEKERQKLGGLVRNSSITEINDSSEAQPVAAAIDHREVYDQILPLAGDGAGVADIARQLDLSEAEVSMVMRFKAA